MANLYHLKSDFDREIIGDLVVNLDKITHIKVMDIGGDRTLIGLETDKEVFKATFKNKENYLATFKEILSKMGADESIADNYVLLNREIQKSDMLKDILASIIG